MARRMARNERIKAVAAKARQMAEALERWYDAHPDASYGEIEEEARRQRREFMATVLETLVNGRDTGFQSQAPRCAVCGNPMDFEGYRQWMIRGLEADARLERAYYLCPECEGQGLFPPGSQAAAT